MSKRRIFVATIIVCVLCLVGGGVFLYNERENNKTENNKTENKKKLTKTEIVKKLEACLQKAEKGVQKVGTLMKFSAKLMPNGEIEIRIDMPRKENLNLKDNRADDFVKEVLGEVEKKFFYPLFELAIPDWKQCKKSINVTFRLAFYHKGEVFYSKTYAAADL